MAEVKLERLRKRFGSVEVIRDLTLTVRDGELFTLVGPSGCGKSTLLHLIAGLETPTEGRIYFDGEDVTDRAPGNRDVALVFQTYALYPHMTVAQNLSFPLRVRAGRRRTGGVVNIEREVRRVAEVLGLDELLERRPRELSGGQRQRVALGRAIIRQPRVFLLDEPLSNLDSQLRAGMRAELRRLHDQLGITTIYVTHDQTEALTLADRLGVLDRGCLQQIGTVQDIYNRPANLFVAGFIGQPPMHLFKARIQHDRVVADPIRLPLPGVPSVATPPAPFVRNVVHDGQNVMVGVRPETIRIRNMETVGGVGLTVRGHVTLVEPGAGQTWVTVECWLGGERLTVVGLEADGLAVKPGHTVAVSFRDAVPHLFDPESGMRLIVNEPSHADAAGAIRA